MIVEDCAQAHGSRIGDKYVGSFGDIATFSFYPTKNLGACGDAGAIVSNDSNLFHKVRSLAQYGWSNKYTVSIPHGRNSRIDELQAAYLDLALQTSIRTTKNVLVSWIAIQVVFLNLFIWLGQIILLHLAVLLAENRDQLRDYLKLTILLLIFIILYST